MEFGRHRLTGIGLAALVLGFVSVAVPGSAERSYPDAVQGLPPLADDSAAAFAVSEDANGYIEIDTTDGSERITLGNLTTDPDVIYATAGLVDVSTGTLDVPAGASMLVNGVAAPAAWTAANLADTLAGRYLVLSTQGQTTVSTSADVNVGYAVIDTTALAAAGYTTVYVRTPVRSSNANGEPCRIEFERLEAQGESGSDTDSVKQLAFSSITHATEYSIKVASFPLSDLSASASSFWEINYQRGGGSDSCVYRGVQVWLQK